MNEQFIRFAADRHDLDSLNKELEKKAIVSESALKRVRWNYAVAVDRLQKDLELLSFQVLSMYETNENLAKQALADVSQIFCPEDREVSKEPYRSGIRRIQSESISTKTDCGMSQIDNGVSDKAGYTDLYSSDFIDESKSVLQRGLHNNLELQTKDNRTYLGVEIEDISYTDSQNKTIQVTGLLPQNGLSSATQKNHSQDQYGESDNRRSVDKVSPEAMTSPHILKELKSNTKAEPSEIHMLSIHWELFTQVLQETLRDVNDGVKNMKHKMVELTQQLEDSSAEKESLMLKWHNTLEEARVLRKDEIKIRSEYDDLMMRNHILEAKLRDVSDKNTSLAQKTAEYMVECQVHESKYESCLVEKNQLEEMLKSESLQKSCLETEIRSTVEGFKALQEEFNKQSSAHSDLQNTTYKLQEKLQILYSSMVSCNEEIHGSTVHVMSSEEKLESDNHMALLSHLEHFQHEVHKKILQLRKEKQEIEEKNDVALCSLNEAKSQILDMEQNFESEMGEITRKLGLANALVGKLNLELEDVTEKLKFSLEAEERSTLKNKELLSKLTILEVEIQQVSDENRDLAQKLLLRNSVSEELENTKSSLTDCMQENRDLMVSIESAKVASIQMEDEVSQLKECLRCAHDEMQLEGRLRKELEATVQDLTLQLTEKVQQLLFSDEQKTELVLLRKRVLDLEKELHSLLSSTEESQRKQNDETSSLHLQVSELENELAGTLHYSLNTDVKVAYMRSQFRSTIQTLVDQNKALQGDLEAGIQQVSDENRDLAQKLLLCNTVCEELENTKSSLMDCMQENRDLMVSIESAKVASIQMEDEINRLKECLRCAHDEIQLEGRLRKELEATAQDLTLQLTEKVQQLLFSDEQKTELVLLRKRVLDLEKELHYVLSSTEESQRKQNDETSSLHLQLSELESELAGTLDHSLNTDVKVAYMRNQFKSTIQALVDQNRALQSDMEELNLKHVDMVTSVESHMVREARLLAENARLSTDFQSMKAECELVSHEKEGLIAQIHEQGGVLADLENELKGTLQNSLNTDVKVAYMKSQFQFLIQALIDQNNALHGDLEELNQKHVDTVTSLEAHMAGKARLLAENARLSEAFQSLKAECELISHEKEGLIAQINEKTAVWADIEDLKARYSVVEACHSQEKLKFEDEACSLRNMVVSLEEEVDSLRSSRDELETTVVILTSKLDEQRNQMSLFENCNHELKKLREQYNELTFKLSEQILKTEEFKNLSIHLRELKDKADAECLQARQRREADGPSLATQESLRIALIKEQCESKLEEVKSQLCASKRYAEEMLLKLQNALDEVESRKKKRGSFT
ncbi:nucleoporin nup211 [Iris pallida]|uniref:Nucleoporin nup211 n=1 Tax=Iris pallida TaxID=29817 RepID=A0AAX6FMD8_IRIPA|nr:nucleoporin nup211 [Iris pallida]